MNVILPEHDGRFEPDRVGWVFFREDRQDAAQEAKVRVHDVGGLGFCHGELEAALFVGVGDVVGAEENNLRVVGRFVVPLEYDPSRERRLGGGAHRKPFHRGRVRPPADPGTANDRKPALGEA